MNLFIDPDSSQHVMTSIIPGCPMVMTRSCDGTYSNMWVAILLPIEQTAPATRSMKGSEAMVRVLYPGYWGTPVTIQPCNPAWDMPAWGFLVLGTQTVNIPSNIHARGASRLLGGATAHYCDVTPGFKDKPNAHSLCAQESSLHTYHTENGYIRTNVSI
jgi:hypothetical protein